MAKKSKWSKFTCLTHHIRSEVGFENLRSIVIQNRTFKGNKAMKKMVFGRKDLHWKWRPRKGQKSQKWSKFTCLTHHIRSEDSDLKILNWFSFKMERLEEKRPWKKWFLGVRNYIGSENREMGKKVKMVKIHVFNPSYTFRGRISKS